MSDLAYLHREIDTAFRSRPFMRPRKWKHNREVRRAWSMNLRSMIRRYREMKR